MALVKKIAKNRSRAFLDKQHVLGPLIHELQDAVETLQTNQATNITNITFANNRVHTVTVPVSFETNEVGDAITWFDSPVTVSGLRSCVTKTLAGTDSGTITAKNNAGSAMASGVLTHAASAAVGNTQTATPTTNNTFVAGDKLTLTAAKTTAGGRAFVTVSYSYV